MEDMSLDTNAGPKSHMNAYGIFMQMCRTEHEKNHAEENVVYAEFLKTCDARWKTLLQEDKNQFYEMADKNRPQIDSKMEKCPSPNGNKQHSNEKSQMKYSNIPKRPLSAFYWFCNDEREKVKLQYPEYGVGDISVVLGRKWIAAGSDVKTKYEAIAHKDKSRYKKELMAYTKSKSTNNLA